MEYQKNKILALTRVTGGVCINDPFISLVNDLSNSLGNEVDYFKFNNDPIDSNLAELTAKDTLDRLREVISDYDFVLVDSRLDKEILNFALGFILSNGNQIGSFLVTDTELQEFLESKTLLRKGEKPENHELLKVCPDGIISEGYLQISEALDYLVKDNYDNIKFLSGVYEENLLYRVLSYCYNVGTIVIDSELPNTPYINVMVLKW